jgi:hypothetical protein
MIQTQLAAGKKTKKQMLAVGISERKYLIYKNNTGRTQEAELAALQTKIGQIVARKGLISYNKMNSEHGIAERSYRRWRNANT